MQIDVNMQLSHMLANDIARSGEESAILDTVHTLKRTVTRDSLSADIQEVFHITIADSKLAGHVKNMLLDGRLIERDSALMLSPASLETITQQIIGNEAIEQKALSLWIQQLETILDRHLNDVEATSVRRIIVKFVARFFITHGAGCYDFINGIKAQNTEKLDDVANLIVESQENCVVTGLSKQEFSHFLVSIFSKDKTVEQEAYLLIQLRKAIQYISMVVDAPTIDALLSSFQGIVVYLDTSILYRLLNLQGEQRFHSIKQLHSFCQAAQMKLKVFQCTVDELNRRISYDAKVIEKHPVPVSFASIGYNSRTDENYISTFWKARAQTGITAQDFNFQFADLLALLDGLGVEVEPETELDEECLCRMRNKVRSFGVFSANDEKSENAVEHDAECLTRIIAQQRRNATSALEAGTFLLSTDWSLVRLQRYDHECKTETDMVVLPSQLLQIFCLSTPDEDYFEAFLGLFASAHIGFGSNQLNNEQVQQIMGRVAYYSERPDFAKRVLCNQLIQQKFAEQETEEEQAAIVDDAIREEIEKLEAENERIANDAQQSQVEIGELRDELSRSQAEKDNQREANEQLIADLKKEFERQHAESLKEIAGLKADKATQDRIIAQGEQTQADTKRRLSEYEHRVDTLQQFYDDVQRKKKRDRLIVWGIVFVLAALGIMVAAVIVILSVLVLIPWSAQFAMTLLSSLAEFCGIQNESVMSFAGYASGVISAVPLPFLIWIAKTAWKKIKGNVDILLSVDSK